MKKQGKDLPKLAWIVVFTMLVFSITGVIFALGAVKDVSISKRQIQQMLSDTLPFEKDGVIVSDIELTLDNQAIQLNIIAKGEKLKQKFAVNASSSGIPHYDNGKFYFKANKFTVNNFTVNNTSVNEGVAGLISKWVDSKKINENKEQIGIQVEKWAERAVEQAVVYALQKIPIYTLPEDMKGRFVRIALESVEVVDNNIVAHLSVWQIGKNVILFGCLFLLSVAFVAAMFICPELLLIFLGPLAFWS